MEREASLLPLVGVAVIYLILTGVLTLSLKGLENKFNYYH